MSVSTADIIPRVVSLEESEPVRAYSLAGHECLYEVGRREADYRESPLLRLLLWLMWYAWGIEPCLPHEYIGVATSEAIADSACLDETYYHFPVAVDRFLPPGRQPIKGLRWPRRAAQLHRDPPAVDCYVPVRESDVERMRGLTVRIQALTEGTGDA